VELPRLEPLWNRYRAKGFSVVVIEAMRDRERALKFIDENELTYHLLENDKENDVVRDQFGVQGFPTSFLMDSEGRIMFYHLGFEKGDEVELEKQILELSRK
jgi:peroxiredoxin